MQQRARHVHTLQEPPFRSPHPRLPRSLVHSFRSVARVNIPPPPPVTLLNLLLVGRAAVSTSTTSQTAPLLRKCSGWLASSARVSISLSPIAVLHDSAQVIDAPPPKDSPHAAAPATGEDDPVTRHRRQDQREGRKPIVARQHRTSPGRECGPHVTYRLHNYYTFQIAALAFRRTYFRPSARKRPMLLLWR